MAEIRNYTLNFGSGRRAAERRGLTWQAKLASAEVQGVVAGRGVDLHG